MLHDRSLEANHASNEQIYREKDKPMYRIGNTVLIVICLYNCALFISAKLFYVWRNRIRDRRWNGMMHAEKATYLATTKDTGNKRLDFRFAH